MASSCVPASAFESPRRPLGPGDLESLLRRRRVIGLAEMMNFPGVVSGDPAELAKLALAEAEHVDGHAPGLLGRDLQAYAAAGIYSDHEALTVEEGRERLRAGMWLLIREASMARNLAGAAAARPRARARADGVLHRRPRPGAHRRRGPHQRDGARRRGGRESRRRTRCCSRLSTRRSGTGSAIWARSLPATRPTCCSCRISSRSSPRSCSSAAVRWRPCRRRTCPTGCARRSGSSR